MRGTLADPPAPGNEKHYYYNPLNYISGSAPFLTAIGGQAMLRFENDRRRVRAPAKERTFQ